MRELRLGPVERLGPALMKSTPGFARCRPLMRLELTVGTTRRDDRRERAINGIGLCERLYGLRERLLDTRLHRQVARQNLVDVVIDRYLDQKRRPQSGEIGVGGNLDAKPAIRPPGLEALVEPINRGLLGPLRPPPAKNNPHNTHT